MGDAIHTYRSYSPKFPLNFFPECKVENMSSLLISLAF